MATRAPSHVRHFRHSQTLFQDERESPYARERYPEKVSKVSKVSNDASALMDRCRSLGIELWADGERIGFDAPAGVLTPELKDELIRHKASILASLAAPPEPTPAPDPDAYALSLAAHAHLVETSPGVWS